MAEKHIVTIGCDPEFFLYNRDDGHFVSSIGLIGGSKDKPRPIEAGESIGLAVLEDNVTLEFNIAPVASVNGFIQNVHEAKSIISSEILRPLNLAMREKVDSVEFAPEALASIEAQTFGCDPDFDAYSQGKQRVPPKPSVLKNWRCAGGHIHLGWDKSKCDVPDWAIVQFLDLCGSLWVPENFTNSVRRQHYGLAGLYRPKPYGIEYRTPNNGWTYNNGTQLVGNLANTIAAIVDNPNKVREWYDLINWKEIGSCLSKGTWNNALHRAVTAQYGDLVNEILDLGAQARLDNGNKAKAAGRGVRFELGEVAA